MAIWASEFRGQFFALKQAVTKYVSKIVPEIAKIREQIKAGVFPIRLRGDEWTSGSNNWLLDIIAPTQQLTTAVIANFGQVVKQSSGGANTRGVSGQSTRGETNTRGATEQSSGGEINNGDLKIHPLITRLVDPEVLKKMGAAPVDEK